MAAIRTGALFRGDNIPPIHRAMSLEIPVGSRDREGKDYILVNRSTNLIKTYQPEEIEQDPGGVIGISVLILNDDLRDSAGHHGVLHSSFQDKVCFVSCTLEEGLGLVVQNNQKLKMSSSPKGYGHHCVVFPLEPMVLETFVAKFSAFQNWQVCRPAAGALSEAELDHEDEDDIFERMPSSGYDMNLSKLVRLLNGLRNEFSLSILRLAVAIRRAIMSLEDKSWDILVQNENVALNIYVFLHHLDVTLDPSVEDSVIFVEYLLDDLDERLQLKNEWQVVDIRHQVYAALLSVAR